MRLDNVDKKLLYLLDQNCRQSATQLAKQLRIHRNVALYRIKRLEQEQVIRGYFTEVDTKKLGYFTFRILFSLSNYSKEEEEALMNYLINVPQLIWLFRTEGKYDIDLVYVAKTISEFDNFVEELNKRFNKIIENEKTGLLTQITHYQKDYLIGKKRTQVVSKRFEEQKTDIDDTDRKLLYLLSRNAKTGIVEIAKETGFSINTVKDRMRKLEKNKVILGYRPFIDTEKTGHTYYKLLINLKNYTPEEYKRINTFFELANSTIYTTKYINGYDLEIELHLENDKKLTELKEWLIESSGKVIKEICALKFVKEYIFRYLPRE